MKDRKSILFIYDHMDKLGGIQRLISILANEFVRQGFSVILLSKNGPTNFKFDFPGRIYKYRMRKKPTWRSKIKTYFKIRCVFSKSHMIIDFREKKSGDYILKLGSKSWAKRKYVSCVSNSKIENYLSEPTQSNISQLRKINRVICLTEDMQKAIHSKYGITNTCVIQNPVDRESIDSQSKNENEISEKPYILASGRFNSVKGFDLLLKAYSKSKLKSDGVRLVILGEGPEEAGLKELAKNLELVDLVQFKGFTKKPYLYSKNALFFVLASRHEAFGNVLIENLYCGTPVISFNCLMGPRYIINHRHNGLLVEPFNRQELFDYEENRLVREEDINSLREAIDTLYSDKNLYQRLKANSKNSVEHLSLEKILKQWLDLVDKQIS